jgi:hypothetical protein
LEYYPPPHPTSPDFIVMQIVSFTERLAD